MTRRGGRFRLISQELGGRTLSHRGPWPTLRLGRHGRLGNVNFKDILNADNRQTPIEQLYLDQLREDVRSQHAADEGFRANPIPKRTHWT